MCFQGNKFVSIAKLKNWENNTTPVLPSSLQKTILSTTLYNL
jgi:hypothetical protein